MINWNQYYKLKKKYNIDAENKYQEHKHFRAPKGSLIMGKSGDEKGRVIAGGGRWVSKNEILNTKLSLLYNCVNL